MNVEQLKARVEQVLQSHHQVDAELGRVVQDLLADGVTPQQLCAAREMLVRGSGVQDVGARLLQDAERGLASAPASMRERWEGYRTAAHAVRSEGEHQTMAWGRIDAAIVAGLGGAYACVIVTPVSAAPSGATPRRGVGSLPAR